MDRHVVHIVQIADPDVVSVAGAGCQQGVIAHRSARSSQERGARKSESYQAHPPGGYADLDRGFIQLNRALIFAQTVRVNPMDVELGSHLRSLGAYGHGFWERI